MEIKKHKIRKIVIANRGEIARRIQRTIKALNIKSVAIYAEDDATAAFVKEADQSFYLGGGSLSDTYLNINKIVDIAIQTKADAIHPGYGFLAENACFARACESAGIIFIGPSAQVIEKMGNKPAATRFAKSLGIPVIPHFTGTFRELATLNGDLPMPCIVKAAAGGGGKGMRVVHKIEALEEALLSAGRQAKSNFGDDTVYVEKYLEQPRHIEVQVLGDKHGNVVHLFERECSLQRNYQKIIEEAPSPTISAELRQAITSAAVKIAEAVGYTSAGTVEFLVDKDNRFYFLEMNTRIQVEHPVTELITGVDIVREQISIAEGSELSFDQKAVNYNGHAIEARICAEDPSNDFKPAPGDILLYKEPKISDVRIDSGIMDTGSIPASYDSLIAKMIVFGENREVAIGKMKIGLDQFIIHGIKTNINFLKSLTYSSDFQNNKVYTNYIDRNWAKLIKDTPKPELPVINDVILSAGLLLSLQNSFSEETLEHTDSVWYEIGYWRHINRIPLSVDENNLLLEFNRLDEGTIRYLLNEKEYLLKEEECSDQHLIFLLNEVSQRIYYSKKGKRGFYISLSSNVHYFERLDIPDYFENEEHFDFMSGDLMEDSLQSPISGRIVSINTSINTRVKKGDSLVVIESMKMENNVVAFKDGVISEIMVKEGDLVSANMSLIKIE